MTYNSIGILAIIGGSIVFIFRNKIVKFRVDLYQKLNKSYDKKKKSEAETAYKLTVILGSIFLVILGIWLLQK